MAEPLSPDEPRRKLAPVDTWPDLRITLHPLPWTWRLYAYSDDVDGVIHGHGRLQVGPLVIEWWANRRWFTEVSDGLTREGA